MKTVEMFRDFDYRATKHRVTAFKAGNAYDRVTEAAAKAIVEADAGRVLMVSRQPRTRDDVGR